jgi:hypothetical protein
MKAAKFLFLFLVNAKVNNLGKLVASKQGFIFQEIKLEELHEKAGTGNRDTCETSELLFAGRS